MHNTYCMSGDEFAQLVSAARALGASHRDNRDKKSANWSADGLLDALDVGDTTVLDRDALMDAYEAGLAEGAVTHDQ